MKNYHNSVILRPKLPKICIYLKIRKFADSPLREKTDELLLKNLNELHFLQRNNLNIELFVFIIAYGLIGIILTNYVRYMYTFYVRNTDIECTYEGT